MDYTVHGILQARIQEWVAIPFSRGSSQPRDQTQVSHIAGRFFTSWATKEAIFLGYRKSLPPLHSAPNCSGLKTSLSTMLPWSPATGELLQWTEWTPHASWRDLCLLSCPALAFLNHQEHSVEACRKEWTVIYRFSLWLGCLRILIHDTSPFSPVYSLLTIGLVVLPSPLLPVPMWWGCSSFLPCPEEL